MKLLRVLFLFSAVAVSACNAQSPQEPQSMDINRVQDCFGHLSFSRPEGLRPVHQFHSGSGDATLYLGRDADFKKIEVSVAAVEISPALFNTAVDARASEIGSASHDVTGESMLVAREDNEQRDRVLLRHYARKSIVEAQLYELHRLVGDVHLVLQAMSYGEGDAQALRSRLASVVATVSVNTSPPVPVPVPGAGLCLGQLTVNAGQDYETARMVYRGVGAKLGGVVLELELDNLPANEALGLVERGEANLTGLGIRPRVLRKGRVGLAGVKGDEWLGVFEAEGHPLHSFFAETSTVSLKQGAPRLQVALHAGEAKNDMEITASPLEDGQAQELWDSIVDSFQTK